MELQFQVKNQRLYLNTVNQVVADSKNYLTATFTFTDDWDGATKIAQFTRGTTTTNVTISNGSCTVPQSVLAGEGEFFVSVYGSINNMATIITANAIKIAVRPSGFVANAGSISQADAAALQAHADAVTAVVNNSTASLGGYAKEVVFTVRGQSMYLTSRGKVVADSQGYLGAKFLFSDDWADTIKVAQFKRDDLFFSIILNSDGTCTIPWEVLVDEGTFIVSVFGNNRPNQQNKIITVNPVEVHVEKSGLTEGELPSNPTYGIDGSVLYEIMVYTDRAEAAASTATSAMNQAQTYASNASDSADDAYTSAGTATTAATNAANSASAAATSATAAQNAQLAVENYASGFAPLQSPAFTGVPTAPTASAGTDTTQIATTAFVQSELADYVTLNDLEDSLEDALDDYVEIDSANYIKSASVSGDTLTLTTGDDTTIGYTPDIPTKLSDLTNDEGYITGVDWDDVEDKPATFPPSAHNHDGVYLELSGGTLTGATYATTQSAGDNSTKLATTAYADTAAANAVADLLNSAPSTLDTLEELADALGGDPNFATTVTTQIGQKLDADSADYIKGVSISGRTITVTKGDDSSETLMTQDTNTTYSAGTGISLSGTTFSNSGVRSIATGGADGTISVNTNGTSTDVAVKGLGSAAFFNDIPPALGSTSVTMLYSTDTLAGTTEAGTYKWSNESVYGKPADTPCSYGKMVVMHTLSSNYITQLVFSIDGNMYFRKARRRNNEWTFDSEWTTYSKSDHTHSDYVTTNTSQNITATKEFNSTPDIRGSSSVVKGTNPSTTTYPMWLDIFEGGTGSDAENRVGAFFNTIGTDGLVSTGMYAYKSEANSTNATSLAVRYPLTGNPYATCPTPDASSNANHISTTAWVNTKLAGYSTTSHNHDEQYSAITHNHDNLYSAISHNHDGRYPLLSYENATPIESNTDFNDITTPGTYYTTGGNGGSTVHSSMSNSPTNGSGGGFVMYVLAPYSYLRQIVCMYNGDTYERARGSNEVWGAWHKKAYTDSDITGNAATATTATTATTAETANTVARTGATTNAARHVWFSHATTPERLCYDDDFKYNPSTNTLTVNSITGNAATATTATTANGVVLDVTGTAPVLGTPITLPFRYKNKSTDSSNTVKTTSPFFCYPSNTSAANGEGFGIQTNGCIAIGAGESAKNLMSVSTINGTTENVYITADNVVQIYSNCDTIANRTSWSFDTNNQIISCDRTITRGTAPSSTYNRWLLARSAYGNEDLKYMGGIYKTISTANVTGTYLYDYPNTATTSTNSGVGGHAIGICHDASGNAYTSAPTPAASSNDTNIATTAWVRTYATPSNIGAAESSHNHAASAITSGTLGVARGGTGETTAVNAANAFLNALTVGSSTPVDADYYISQYVNGGTTTTTYHRRPMSALWSYIKSKADEEYSTTDTKVTATKVSPTSNTTYYILGKTSSDTGTAGVAITNSVRFQKLTGTASAVGYDTIALGNATGTGTAGNQRGRILLYNDGTNYTYLYSHTGDTSNRTLYTPKSGGTLVCHTTDTAIGSASTPVYVTANGVATECTSLDATKLSGTIPTDCYTNTTYSAGTAALLTAGTNTSNRVWQAKIIADYVKGTLSAAQDGYVELPSGLIINWGKYTHSTTGNASNVTVTFPKAYSTACYSIALANGGSASSSSAAALSWHQATSITKTNFNIGNVNGNYPTYWIAIGV